MLVPSKKGHSECTASEFFVSQIPLPSDSVLTHPPNCANFLSLAERLLQSQRAGGRDPTRKHIRSSILAVSVKTCQPGQALGPYWTSRCPAQGGPRGCARVSVCGDQLQTSEVTHAPATSVTQTCLPRGRGAEAGEGADGPTAAMLGGKEQYLRPDEPSGDS